MPCFNQKLIEESFFCERKIRNSFILYMQELCLNGNVLMKCYRYIKKLRLKYQIQHLLYTLLKKEAQDYLKKI